jgi:hypothetical protein
MNHEDADKAWAKILRTHNAPEGEPKMANDCKWPKCGEDKTCTEEQRIMCMMFGPKTKSEGEGG